MNRILFLIMVWLSSMSILAQTDGYDPANPPLPEAKYKLTLNATPKGAGTFNVSSATLVKGEAVSLYAYTNTNFKFVKWMDAKADTLVSTKQNFSYVMPGSDVSLTAVYEYAPESPKNPGRNKFDSSTGEVIVDDFTPGSLASAIQELVGNNKSSVAKITVAGVMSDNDFSIANDYSNCSVLDLSRVTGIMEIPSYAFDNTNIETIYLPATIEKIGTRAFARCTNLSSITIYAMTPPVLENNVFQGVPEDVIIYVPMAVISLYQDVEAWGKFTLLPIQEDIRNINVSLPQGTNTADYAQMWLELTNTKSGQRMHYVMTDRMQYTFADIICNTSWNITLRNERGDIFGHIDNIEVKDEDVNVVFNSLSKPLSVVLSVLTPDNQDVTEQTRVIWTDAQGNYLSQGPSLKGLPVGYQATYTIVLPQQLAMAYNSPNPVDYILSDDNNEIIYQLNAIPQVRISGKVKDLSTGLSLSGAIISASQTFGGKYSKTLNVKTDCNGIFTLDVANVPTSVAFAASDYISQTINCDSLLTGVEEVTLSDVSLKAITGATITLDFTYTSCDGDTHNWYSDYLNVNYNLFNVTQNKVISKYNVQYPQIVLLEDIADGDVLKLTATSRTNAFMPITTTTTIVKQRAEATLAVVELGKIQASFTSTGNASVVGSLYDVAGKLVKTYNYSNALLTISDLADGKYTLVSMGDSRLFNTIYDLSQLSQTGFVEDVDYVLNSVEVKSGHVTAVSINSVPTLDERKLYYTGDNTSFTVNKQSIVAGHYLTLTGHVDFQPAYANNVSNVQMIVDLPESCEFVENSVMVGNSTSSYTFNGHKITIPMARYTDRVRFCIIPTLGGEYTPSAFVQFDLNGKMVTQPIGSANYTAKDLSISVPSTVAKTTIPVSGTAIGTSKIEIYDNDILIGNTNSLANGTWEATCELNNPYNLSTHNIYAKVTTKSKLELISEIKQVMYDLNMVVPEKVTMLYHNPEFVGQYNIVFDLINRTVSPKYYYFFPYKSYPNWPGSGTEPKDFTFIADLSNNDSTAINGVTIRVYTDNGIWHNLKAQYNTSMNRWVAVSKFEQNELPVGVKVKVNAYREPVADALYIKDINHSFNELCEEYNNGNVVFDAANTTEEIQHLFDNMGINLFPSLQTDTITYRQLLEKMSIEELWSLVNDELNIDLNYLDTLTTIKAQFDAMTEPTEEINQLMNDGTQVYFGSCEGVTTEYLEDKGFSKILTTEGYYVYSLVTDSISEYVCFETNTHYKMVYSNSGSARMNAQWHSNGSSIESILNWGAKIDDALNMVKSRYDDVINLIGDWPKKLDDAIVQAGKDIISYNKKWQECHQLEISLTKSVNSGELSAEELRLVKEQIKSLQRAQNKYNDKIAEINKRTKYYPQLIKGAKNTVSTFQKVLPFTKYISIANNAYQNITTFRNLYNRIPECPKYPNMKSELQALTTSGAGVVIGALVTKLGVEAVADMATAGQVVAAPATGGTSLVSGFLTMVGKIAFGLVMDAAYDKAKANVIHRIESAISDANKKCKNDDDDDDDDNDNDDDDDDDVPHPQINPMHDPSGYVYEGVASNRLQGVKASCYYKETVEDVYGDLHENVVLWDAEEYAQENPLFTDEYGMYRWDVPKGMWQVKFEKEGYETTYSEWLPVPPPQLDVNIAMKQNVQPEVKVAHAYEDAVEVEFDKYMMSELLTTENIMVMQNGTAVDGSVELLNEEVSYEDESETFASKIRFNAAQPFTGQEITLIVSNRVKSYAGIRMQENYQQAFAIEQEIKQIVSDSIVTVGYGNTSAFVVSVLPASAARGKMLTVKTSSPMILGIETELITIDNEGKAEIIVSGELPGTTALTFTIEGTDKMAMVIANVEQSIIKTVATPKASIASGTVVEKGTAITLTCETEGATIYYTLDGSCPCENTEARKVYDGTPIIISESVTIKAMAMAPDMYESDVAEFIYIVDATNGIDDTTTNGQILIYPMPVRDKVNISASGRTIKSVIVSSMNGTIVASTSKPATMVTINVSSMAAGVYIVKIKTEENIYSRKVLVVQ